MAPVPVGLPFMSASEEFNDLLRAAVDAAESSASRAQRAAEAADASARKAMTARSSLENEIKKLKQDGVRWGVATFLSVAALFVLVWQTLVNHWQLQAMTSQTELARGQLSAMKDQNALSNGQLALSRGTSTLSLINQAKNDISAFRNVLHNPKGLLAVVENSSCSPIPEEIINNTDINDRIADLIGDYEVYYVAARKGVLDPQEWKQICAGAEKLFGENCYLRLAWEESLKKLESPEFIDAFVPKCEVQPEPEQK